MEGAASVLIVSASTGTGHLRAGEALRSAFGEAGSPAAHVDLLALAPRWVRALYGGGYEVLASRAPRLWRELYARTDGERCDRARWGPLAHRILFREFRRLLLSRPWSACVATHFLPAQLAAGTPGAPPFSLAVTDFALHPYWVQPRVRRYFVAGEATAAELERRLPGMDVTPTGIPISPRFARAPERGRARAALGLDPARPVVLVLGGGMGIHVDSTALAAADAPVEGLQVLAVCGHNAAAARRLRAANADGDRIRTFGFVDDLERMVAAADLVATKPGGLTVSEVLAVGRPLLLTRPIPGQEEGNRRALLAAGAALDAPDVDAVRVGVRRAFREPGLLERLAGAAASLGRPASAASVADAVLGTPLRAAVA